MIHHNWFYELDGNAVSEETHRCLLTEHAELRHRIVEGGRMLTERDAELCAFWLDLEADINDWWSRLAEMHFNAGVERGLSMLDEVLANRGVNPKLAPAAAVRALASALLRIAEQLNPD
jgi:hypothetical protein